ncbi:MAG: hypothetical protein WD826_10905, partial [Actinomycetota bacterium]
MPPLDAMRLYRLGRSVAERVPDAIAFGGADLLGTAVARGNAKRRAVVRRNLARVVGEQGVERYVDQAFRSYARYWFEALRLPKPGIDEIRRRTTVEGIEGMAKYLDNGQGVIFVSGHIGSYDVAGAWLASYGWRVLAVAEEVEPPELFEWFTKLRADVGVDVVPAGKGSTARALLNGLKTGAAVGLV